MPPPVVKTIRDLIFWQYAKIISESAGTGKANYGFIMDRFKKLSSGEINWSTSIREYVREREDPERCVYCSSGVSLSLEHILPKSRGGPDDPSNAIWICRKCNSSKGNRRLYEWYGLDSRNSIPRIAEGKYLKLLHELHSQKETLNHTPRDLCAKCDMSNACPEKGELTVY